MTTKVVLSLLCCAVIGGMLAGCVEEAPPSLYDNNYVSGPQPTLTGIDPPGSALAGVTTMTLTGTNFSPVLANNLVFFDATIVPVLQASATQLQIRAPNIVKDTVKIKVAVFRSDLFSNSITYRLTAAFQEIKAISASEQPWGTTADTAGNVYVSIAEAGIKKYAPDGTKSDWAPSGGFTKWSALKFGRNNTIYAALGLPAIFTITQGGNPDIYLDPGSGVGNVFDFDFDALGNLWAGGENTDLYRVAPDKTVKSYPFNANVRSVRVFNGYLYVAGKTLPDGTEKVVRFAISPAGELGAAETYFDFSASPFAAGGKSVYAVNFAANGDMFLGTDCTDPIIRVTPAKTASAFYPGLFGPTMHIMPWGVGTEMIAVKGSGSGGAVSTSQKVYRINMQVQGAPYYGRN